MDGGSALADRRIHGADFHALVAMVFAARYNHDAEWQLAAGRQACKIRKTRMAAAQVGLGRSEVGHRGQHSQSESGIDEPARLERGNGV